MVNDLDQFLDDLLAAKDDDETEKKKIRDRLTQRETELMKAGQSIREMATVRKKKDGTRRNCDSI